MNINNIVKTLRQFRSLHRYIGVGLAFFLLITATTGVLLGWKKDSDVLQPPTRKGTSTNFSNWKSFRDISTSAARAMDSVGNRGNEIERLDVQPGKGIVKVLFKQGYWEVQVDGATGKILSVAQRHSDWIEHIHDGSIINDLFKLAYTNILGIGMLILGLTGVYMWYGPKVVRRSRNRN